MDRSAIRTRVRDRLGEPSAGFWLDEELDRYIQDACDRHAMEGLSVEAEIRTSSIAGVREYIVDDSMGQVIGVRYDDGTDLIELAYLKKARTLDFAGVSNPGTPSSFYWFNDIIGLDPIPDKVPSAKYNDTDDLDTNQDVTGESVGPLGQSYTVSSAINVSTTSLYLRKFGNPDGEIFVELATGGVGGAVIPNGISASLEIFGLETHYNWTHFSFEFPPENLASTTYFLRLRGDATYQADYSAGATAVQWGVDASSPTFTDGNFATYASAAWSEDTAKDGLFEVHPFRDDIIIDFYKNVTNPMTADTDIPETPTRYHPTIVNLVCAQAFAKDSYDLASANRYEEMVSLPMLISRAQAMKRTQGRRLRGSGLRVAYPQGSIVINNP